LSGTGLTYKYLDDKAVTIVPAAAPRVVTSDSTAANDAVKTPSAGERFRLAQTETTPVDQGEARDEASVPMETNADADAQKGIPEILVRGSKFSLNTDIARSRDDLMPYVVLGSEAIRSSGATNVGELLNSKLTMNYSPEVGNFVQNSPQI